MLPPETQETYHEADDLLWRHLKSLPAFRALLRAVEARYYRHLDIPEPVLDLGCGDGHFAKMAFGRPLTAGVDPWWGPLQKARKAAAYRLNIQALGDALPFADDTFASVISNSVLEHIPDVQPVLNEAARVLQANGRLVITMPSHLFTENLGGAALLQPVGLSGAYRRFFNRVSRHAHTDPPQEWARRLHQAGFAVERWQYYFSTEALRALEMGHVQGLPSAVLHFLTGHWVIAPWRSNLRFTERWLRPYYEEEQPPTGAYLLMVARKTSPMVASTDSVEIRLPPPRPLPTTEPAGTMDQQPVESNVDSSSGASPALEEEAVFRFPAPDATSPPQEADRRPTGANRVLIAGFLLLSGVLAAITAQSTLAQRVPSSWTGLIWYGIAIGAFGASALLLRRPTGPTMARAPFTSRLLLYPLALALALLVHEQSGGSLFAGNPLVAIFLWLASGALAFVALAPEGSARQGDGQSVVDADARAQSQDAAGRALSDRTIYAMPLVAAALFLLALLPRLLWLTDHPFILNGIEASIGLDAVALLQGQYRNPFATAWLTNPVLPLYPVSLSIALFGRTILGVRLISALVGAATIPLLFFVARRLWGQWFALTAAVLLAGYHLHIHYSRLGMTNAWDPLLALLMFGAIALAARHASRRNWLIAGAATGLTFYFFTPSHLAPFYLLALLLYALFWHRDFLANHWSHLLAAAALALVVALPQIMYYRANPGLFMERANTLGIFQSDWLLQQAAAGRPIGAVLVEQLQRAFFAFNGSLDTSTSYNPGIPLLRYWPSIFYVVGIGFALWRIRDVRYGILLIWLVVTLLFGGAFLVDAPDSHRLLISAPAVILLLTAGLYWLARLTYKVVSRLFGKEPFAGSRRFERTLAVVFVLATLFVAGDLLFYFGQYRTAHRFGDRNSEIAHEMGQYLDSLPGDWQVQFYGPPTMYVSFPTILYLAEGYQPGVNLLDVPPDAQEALDAPPGTNLALIFLPERSAELDRAAGRYAPGTLRTFSGILADPLFYAYEVHP